MIEHTFWKAMPCVFDWIRENRLAEIQQFRTIISKAIKNRGFQFTSMEEAINFHKKLYSFDYCDFWDENDYDSMWLERQIKKYIFEKRKHKVMSEIKTKMGIVENSHESSIELKNLEKLELEELDEYLHYLLEYSPYSSDGYYNDDYEFQMTSEHDLFFRTLAKVAEIKQREIL
jgi:hypothetical protein